MRTAAILALIGAASAVEKGVVQPDCIYKTYDVCHEINYSCTCYYEWIVRGTSSKADMEIIQAKAKNNMAIGTSALAAATQNAAALATQVTNATNLVNAKKTDMNISAYDKTSLAYKSAEAAHSSAIAIRDAKTQEHFTADALVTKLQDEKSVLTLWINYGKEWLANTLQPHQVTWNTRKIADARLLSTAQAIQAGNVAKAAALTNTKMEHTQYTKYVTAGKAELLVAANTNKWHTNLLADATTATNVRAILNADKLMKPMTPQIYEWIKEDTIALTAANKLESARAAAWNKAATAAAANSVEATKNTREKAGAELSELRAAYDVAEAAKDHGAVALAAACKLGAPLKVRKEYALTNDCESLKAEQVHNVAVLDQSRLFWKTSKAYYERHYPVKTGATAGIIVGVITGIVILGLWGWDMHSSKKEAKRILDKENADVNGANDQIEVPMLGGEASINAAVGDGQMFFSDDCYTAMVDTEQ